ncbi:putative NRPS-like protein biosynthetic cluster [Claviceps pusilla]|uniref:NRPS-like protein biosynthetic cluster n=1 Tax=Claviceps pusilla TaxID=123648 RepID=A0A9P7N8G2_9HYPO|nr:putative NRPS-like protein biosynthetic cluster [Claviceps pusilla]
MESFLKASTEVTALISQLYNIPVSEVKNSPGFRALIQQSTPGSIVLASIPPHPVDPFRPVFILYLILTELPGPWHPPALFHHFTRLTKGLVPASLASRQDDTARLVRATEDMVKQSYESLTSFLSHADLPALYLEGRQGFISHREVSEFVSNFALPVIRPRKKKPVIAIFLPDGPLLAALCLAIATYYVAVPIPPYRQSASQLQSHLERAQVDCVIRQSGENQIPCVLRQWIQSHDIEVITADLDTKNYLRDERGRPVNASVLMSRPRANRADDVSIIKVQGNSGLERDLVRITTHDLLRDTYAAVKSWNLASDDRGISMASVHDAGLGPIFMAPIVAGGSVVCCSPTDISSFWTGVDVAEPSWFVASHATHRIVLASASLNTRVVEKSKFRLACGADGSISPQLADMIYDVFGCCSVTEPPGKEYVFDASSSTTLRPQDLEADEERSSMPEVISPGSSPVTRKQSGPSGHKGTTEAWEQDLRNWHNGKKPQEPRSSGESPNRSSRLSRHHLILERRKSSKASALSGETILPGQPDDIDNLSREDSLGAIDASEDLIRCGDNKIDCRQVEQAIMAATEMEQSPIYRRIAQVLSFPASHDLLVQDVAVILVTRPESPRVGLRTLHDALAEVNLDPVKWPMLIVYMDSLPLRNREPVRTRLRQRFNLPSISKDTTLLARHWEATCPGPNTSVMKPIECRPCRVVCEALTDMINSALPSEFRAHLQKTPQSDEFEAFIAPTETLASLRSMRSDWEEYIRRLMTISTHGYMIPANIYVSSDALPRNQDGAINESELQRLRRELRRNARPDTRKSIRAQVAAAFAAVLACDVEAIDPETNFYKLEATSDQAGHLLRRLRAEFNIDLTHTLLAKDATVEAIARFIEPQFAANAESHARHGISRASRLHSSTRWWLMLLQLLPLIILYPARRSAQWTVQLWLLSRTRFWEDNRVLPGRLSNLILSHLGAWASVTLIFPLVGIALKWIIIGRHREGQYPMWGSYHTRWWMVQKITSLCGMGFFDANDYGRTLYCRLMGAKIGRGVRLNGVVLGEWDLLDIRDGASLTKCECRPFAAERNSTMYLARIVIGERATVGVFSIVAPGTEVLPDCCLGANSSSWEQRDSMNRPSSDDDANTDSGATDPRIRIEKPHWAFHLLLTRPIYGLGWVISLTPWLSAQVPVQYKAPMGSSTPLRVIIDWFQGNPAIAFHYVAVMGRVLVTPLLFLVFAVTFRFLCVLLWGDLPTDPSQAKGGFPSWRASVMKRLYPEEQLVEINELLGQHHEARSLVLRLLGAKIGKRVCWPNCGPSISDYHLLNIGNDVTLGANCQVMTSDEHGSGLITIRDGAVLGDNCCILPGVMVGERTTIGFGGLTRRGKEYHANKTFVGCRNGDVVQSDSLTRRLWHGPTPNPSTEEGGMEKEEKEDDEDEEKAEEAEDLTNCGSGRKNSDVTLVDVSHSSSSRMEEGRVHRLHQDGHAGEDDFKTKSQHRNQSRPDHSFHRARHMRKTPYLVLPPLVMLGFSMFMTTLTEFYWNVPALSSMKLASWIFARHFTHLESRYDPVVLYLLNTTSTIALTLVSALVAVGTVLLMKRLLIGKFKPGIYDWDKSSYCQRWQILLAVEKLIRHCYVDKGGIISLLTGTQWLVLYYRALGATIGRDCALFASGNPSLMLTEPDLIEMGDRVVVDNAAIISHLDRRGSVQLDRIKIGSRCVLRSSSNLLLGSVMEDDGCLLEHTLILPGERIGAGWTMHRRPAERFLGNRKGTIPRK